MKAEKLKNINNTQLNITALFCSQEVIVWRAGSGQAFHVGVCKTYNIEVFFIL